MKAWIRHHLRSLTGALGRFAHTPFATLCNTLAIAVSLALPLGAYIAVFNLQSLSGYAESSAPQLSVFLALDAGRKDMEAVEKALKESEAVRSHRFVGKDEALAQMKRNESVAEIAAALKNNPLPDAFVADLRPGTADAARALVEELRALPKIAQVQLDVEWLQRLEHLLNLGKLAVGLLALLLAFALVAVTFNTVRMQILTQRDEIEVSQLVGATDAYIRRPFYYQGALLGLLGGALALGLAASAGIALNPQVQALAQSYGSGFRLVLPPWPDLIALLAFAGALGWLGAWLSVSKHLRNFRPH